MTDDLPAVLKAKHLCGEPCRTTVLHLESLLRETVGYLRKWQAEPNPSPEAAAENSREAKRLADRIDITLPQPEGT